MPDADDIFAALDQRKRTTRPTELASYLREDPIKADHAKEPVCYWLDKTGDRFARMALYFVTAPGEFLI